MLKALPILLVAVFTTILTVYYRTDARQSSRKNRGVHSPSSLLQKLGNIPDEEMYRVFNMGIGMAVVINKKAQKYFKPLKPICIGEIIKDTFGVKVV